ncbi:VOC family protein, partial [Nocardia gipuzkoensis]
MTLTGGPITQIAWVVADVAAAENFLGTRLGVRSWNRMPDIRFGPDSCTYRGAPADFTAHISLSYSGPTQLELIEPVRGESIYSEFLRECG